MLIIQNVQVLQEVIVLLKLSLIQIGHRNSFASHTEHMKLWNMHMTCFGPFLTNYVVQKNSQTDSPDSSLINGSHVFDTVIVCLLQIRILYGCTEG